MFRHLSITAAALVISLTGAAVDYTDSISPTVDTHQSVGLVLSGGGAKGIAHIGVIQALEDNDIPIDYITGTSMGAIVGSLYAIGYTPDEMMQLLLSPEFADWSTGRINENLVYYFAKKEPSPEMFSFPLSLGDSASVTQFPASLVSPLPMNFAFMDLYAAYTAQCGGDFDKLFVPFRCIASDITNKHKVVCRGGQLGDAVRASMSFPVVFQPIEMDSVLLYDGGIYDNFPVDVMRSEFAPSIMIGVDVHGTTDPAKARELVNQIEEMVIQNNDYDLPADQGIKIRLHLDNFSLLDFPAARQIYDIGYNRTIEMMDSIKSRITSRIPASTRQLQRNVFKSATPGLRFDKIEVNGGTKQENDYIRYLFTKNRPDTFGIKSARLSYYHAITPGKLADLFPTAIYNPSSQLFKLKLRADVKNNLTVGIGGYLTSSANSMLYLNSRYTSMSLKSMDASLGGWLGQSYLAAALNTRLILPSHTPTALSLQAVVSRRQYHENDKLFFDNSAPSFVTAIEAFGRLRYTVAAGRSAKATIDVGGGTHISRFYNSEAVNFSNAMRDNTKFNIAQARMLFEASTLDNLTAPTAGYFANVTAEWNTGKYHFQPGTPNAHKRSSSTNWLQAQAKLRYFGRISDHFSLGGELNALYSNRKLLDNYNASIVNAPAFTPTPVADNSFNPAFRANAFAAIGVVPVWIINDNLQLRGNFHMFRPIRRITADDNTTQSNFAHLNHDLFAYCELSAAYTFRSVTLSAYGNFQSYPHDNWNVGMSFGIYFLAPTLN